MEGQTYNSSTQEVRQEHLHEFKVNQGYKVRPYLRKPKTTMYIYALVGRKVVVHQESKLVNLWWHFSTGSKKTFSHQRAL